ncbi:MAG: TolB protein [Thermoleophilaceae bacterium]|jgi:Tol biopolymer transport system component|nr:TolB protein [Thermoleophilaceae bacterium]
MTRRTLPSRAATAALALVGLALLAAPSLASSPRITFVRQDGGDTTSNTHSRVYTVKPDGSGVFEVTHDGAPVDTYYTAWRPDHTLILFVGRPLETVKPNGTQRHELPEFKRPSADSPTYRSDGQLIAFTTNNLDGENTHYAIATVKSDGSGYHRLTKFSIDAQNPTFSPSGKSIAFERGGQIWRMRSDGSQMKKVTHGSCVARSPDWSSGKSIAYSCNGRILTVHYGGGGRHTVVKRVQLGGGFADNPAWSPDDSRIVFDAEGSLYTVKTDGGGLDQITVQTGNRFDERPDW